MEIIQTTGAPVAVGAYSQGVRDGGTLHASGQISLHPETNQLVEGTPAEQTHQIMSNLGAVLAAGGCDFSRVRFANISLRNAADFREVNEAYATYFPGRYAPARQCVEAKPPIPGADVEISMIASVPWGYRLRRMGQRLLNFAH